MIFDLKAFAVIQAAIEANHLNHERLVDSLKANVLRVDPVTVATVLSRPETYPGLRPILKRLLRARSWAGMWPRIAHNVVHLALLPNDQLSEKLFHWLGATTVNEKDQIRLRLLLTVPGASIDDLDEKMMVRLTHLVLKSDAEPVQKADLVMSFTDALPPYNLSTSVASKFQQLLVKFPVQLTKGTRADFGSVRSDITLHDYLLVKGRLASSTTPPVDAKATLLGALTVGALYLIGDNPAVLAALKEHWAEILPQVPGKMSPANFRFLQALVPEIKLEAKTKQPGRFADLLINLSSPRSLENLLSQYANGLSLRDILKHANAQVRQALYKKDPLLCYTEDPCDPTAACLALVHAAGADFIVARRRG